MTVRTRSGKLVGCVRRRKTVKEVQLEHKAQYTPALEKQLRDAGWKNVQARIRPKRRAAILRKMERIGGDDAYGNDGAYNRSIHALVGGKTYYSLEAMLISYLRFSDVRMDYVGSGLSPYYGPESQQDRAKWAIAYLLWLQDGLLNDDEFVHVPPHPQFLAIVGCMSAVIRDRIVKRIGMGMDPCGAHGYYPERFHKGINKLFLLLTQK
jgi:hypothetical protein